jgi:hypothetical protein
VKITDRQICLQVYWPHCGGKLKADTKPFAVEKWYMKKNPASKQDLIGEI